MANLTGGTIAANNSEYNILQTGIDIIKDAYELPYMKQARELGIINDHTAAFMKKAGDTIVIANRNRLNSTGMDTSVSLYPQVKTPEFGNRTLQLKEYADGLQYDDDTTISVQRDSLGVLKELGSETKRLLREHFSNLVNVGYFQTLAGNTAASISAPDVSDVPFTGNKLLNATLLTPALAPSVGSFSYGSNAALANPSAITATNAPLTYQDLQREIQLAGRTFGGVTRFSRLTGKPYRYVIYLAYSAYFGLYNQAKAAGANMTLGDITYAQLNGGKNLDDLTGGIMLPDLMAMIIPVDEQIMPRATHAGVENLNSRCCLIVGKGALDMGFGAAYTKEAPSANVIVDDVTFKADGKIRVFIKCLMAGRKVQLNGSGINAANKYDFAVRTIYHSTTAQ